MSLTDNKVREIPVYWEWKLETGETAEEINDNDIEDSKFMGRTMSMQIAVVGKQVLERPKYTVTFDVNGGGTLSENTRTVDAEFELGTLPTLTRDGYIFDGWFTKSDGGSQIDETTKMQYGDVTYYAHWTKNYPLAKDILKVNLNATTTEEKSPYVWYPAKDGSEGNKILCRVLYNDNEHELQIISQNSVDTVYLGYRDENYNNDNDTNLVKCQNSYNNAIENLNNKAEIYINSELVADARCVGSASTVTNNTFANKNDEELLTTSGSFSYLQTYVDQGYKGTDNNYNIDYNKMQTLGLASPGYSYWLASRYVYTSPSYGFFDVRFYNYNRKTLNEYSIFGTSGATRAPSYGFRPVFLIKSNVKITYGTGTLDDPYELGI